MYCGRHGVCVGNWKIIQDGVLIQTTAKTQATAMVKVENKIVQDVVEQLDEMIGIIAAAIADAYEAVEASLSSLRSLRSHLAAVERNQTTEQIGETTAD